MHWYGKLNYQKNIMNAIQFPYSGWWWFVQQSLTIAATVSLRVTFL